MPYRHAFLLIYYIGVFMSGNKDENAKNPDFKVPIDLPSVKPEDYDASIDSGRGSAKAPQGQAVKPGNQEDPAKREQKKHGQLPLHDEAIGGA
jgi:hypothetical protein